MTESGDIQSQMQKIAEQHIQNNPDYAEGSNTEDQGGEQSPPSSNQNQSFNPPNPFAEEAQTQPEPQAPMQLGEFERLAKIGKDSKTLDYKEGILKGNKIVVLSLDNKQEMKALDKAGGYADDIKAKVFNMYRLTMAIQNVNGEIWPTRNALSDADFDKILEDRFQIILNWNPSMTNVIIRDYISFENEIITKAEYAKK